MAADFNFNDGKGKVAMMQQGNMIIEIYQMPESELTEIRKRKNGHINYIAFDVTDIDEAFSEIKSADFALIEKAPFFFFLQK